MASLAQKRQQLRPPSCLPAISQRQPSPVRGPQPSPGLSYIVPASPILSPSVRLSPATLCYVQELESLLAILPWWGWVGLCVIVALLACCCLICACALTFLWRKQRKAPLESMARPGTCAIREPRGPLTSRAGKVDSVIVDHQNAQGVQRYLEAAPTAQENDNLSRADPSMHCVMKSDLPHSSKSWEMRSLSEPAKFSSTLGSSCRLEYEEDRRSSEASRSKPPRQYESQGSDSVSRRAIPDIGHIINTLRESFGQVRV